MAEEFALKNGRKINREEFKRTIKEGASNFNEKSKKILSAFDVDKNSKLDDKELDNIFNEITEYSANNGNSVFEVKGAEEFINKAKTTDGKTLKELGIKAGDVFDFLGRFVNSDEENVKRKKDNNFTYTMTLKDGYGDDSEGVLEWGADSLAKIRTVYPNAEIAYLKNGKVTVLDKSGEPVLDKNGNALEVAFKETPKTFSEELAEMSVLGHKASPLEKIMHQAEIQKELDRLNSLETPSESYLELSRSIEFQKMNKKEQTEAMLKWTGEKFYQAKEQGDYAAMKEYLAEGFGLAFQKMDMASIGNTKISVEGFKDFLKTWSGFDAIVGQLDKVIDDNNSENITTAEKIWAFTKGVGDAIDGFIGTQGVAFMGTLSLAGEAAAAGGIGEAWALATQAYFGYEGVSSVAEGAEILNDAKTEEEFRLSGEMVGNGAIMMHGAYKSFKGGLTGKLQSGMEAKKAVKEIQKCKSAEEITELRENLKDLSYAKEEVAFLDKECLKRLSELKAEENAKPKTTDVKPEAEVKATPETEVETKTAKFENRMEYKPETGFSQVSTELAKESFLQHLRDIGLDEDMVKSFSESIENGSIDLSVCKDFIEVVKNDKELLSDILGSMIFDGVKAEDIPAKIEAYKLAKSQGDLSVMDQAALILETTSSKTPQKALAEVVLSNKYEDIKNSDIQSSSKKEEMIQALKDCAEKNGAEFVLENFELLSRNYKFASEVNGKNIETAKLLDEYQIKTNRPVSQERSLEMLAKPEQYASRIKNSIDKYEQQLEKINNNKAVTQDCFEDVLKSLLTGDEAYRNEYVKKISEYFCVDGQVPSNAIELIKLIKENFKNSLSGPNSSIDLILSKAASKIEKSEQANVIKPLTGEQINEMIDYINILNSKDIISMPYVNLADAIKHAKDVNGDFSAKQITELYKKGLTFDDIEKMYICSLDRGKVNYATFNVLLEIAKYDKISPEVKRFLKDSIIISNRHSEQVNNAMKARLEGFKSNAENTINFLERAFKDGYLDEFSSGVIDVPVSDLQIKLYDLLPKPINTNIGYKFIKTLKYVNDANLIVFEKVMERARTVKEQRKIDCNKLQDVLAKVQNKAEADLIAKSIDNKIFDTETGIDTWQIEYFTDQMQTHPEIVREWVDNNVNLKDINIEEFSNFINGLEPYGETPLTKEQRKLVYEIINLRGENRYPNIGFSDNSRTDLLELSPKYYELVKKCVAGENCYFTDAAKFIKKYAEDKPELLETLEKDIDNNPKLVKYFNLDTILKDRDKVGLLLEHEDLLKSFKEGYREDPAAMFEAADYEILKDGLSVLKDVPDEVKTNFNDALAKIYTLDIANKLGMTPVKSGMLSGVYKKSVNYEKDVAEKLLKTIWPELGDSLHYIELSNLDFVANYIKTKKYPRDSYIIKVLNSSEDIGKNTAILTEMLENKDKLLKQVAIRCQNTNTEFVKFAEEYLKGEDVYDLVFMPNFSMNTLVNNFFEVSKIFQYVNTKPQDYINGHYNEKIIDALKDYRKKDSERNLFNSLSAEDKATVEQINNTINQNIDNKFTQILDAISSTDIETVKLLLDKRFSIFQDKMSEINDLSGAAKGILSDVIRNGKRINKNGQPDKLTGQQKIDMINLIKCATSIIDNFDINNYKTPLKKGAFILDSEKLHNDIFRAILSKKGLSQEEINNLNPENLNWNMKYLSLLHSTPARDNGELADVVRAASKGNFTEYINDVSNKYGKTNLQTRQAFERNGVNYDQWIKPNVPDVEFEVAGKQCHIKMWDRNPQEDMFLGSKTSCCTALDRTNGGSMAVYMLNTSYNVVELCDAKGDVVGMSRVFMANVDGKPTLIMDNIELNHGFIKGMNFDSDIKDIRDNFFKYMNTYAEKITGDPNAQVLFYSGDIHVPNSDLTKVNKSIDFLGDIHREEVYVNAVHCSYHNPAKLKDVGNITWLQVPKK